MGVRTNKYSLPAFIFLLSLLLVSCGGSKKVQTSRKQDEQVAPVKSDTLVKTTEPDLKPEKKKQTEIKIALVLPLQIEAHVNNDTTPDTNPLLIQDAMPALHFYEGALQALESLSSDELKITLHVFDAPSDSISLLRIFNKPDLRQCHAVIAMVPAHYNAVISRSMQSSAAKLFLLQGTNADFLSGQENTYLVLPGNRTQLQALSSFLWENFPASEFVSVYREQRREDELSRLFASDLDSISGKNGLCKQINFKSGWSQVEKSLSIGKRNIVFIPSSDEAWIGSLLRNFKEQSTKNIMLCGLPTWEKFDTPDPELLQKLNTHFFNSQFVDYTRKDVSDFRTAFINVNYTDPLPQAYMGFDLVQLVVKNFDSIKLELKTGKKYTALSTSGFYFERNCKDCGFENKTVNVIYYSDYKLVKAGEVQR